MTKSLLHVLHGRNDVDRSLKIIDGVYAGGVTSASELIRLGLARPEEFKLLAGYSGWGPYQLQREIESGSWWVVAASHTLILDCLREPSGWSPGNAGNPSAQGPEGPKDDAKVKCWKKVLTAAGIKY